MSFRACSLYFLLILQMGLLLVPLTRVEAAAGDGPPNVVFILADDLGYGDVGPYKTTTSTIPTPNIDRLAQEGMIFTDAHTPSSVCAPSRYSLLTGNYPYRGRDRWGVWRFTHKSNFLSGQQTVADILRAANYATAFIGKMHLGGDFYAKNSNSIYRGSDATQIDFTRQFRNGPTDHGFDYSWVTTNGIQASLYAYFENETYIPINQNEPGIVALDIGPMGGGVIQRAGFGDANWDSSLVGPTLTQKAVEFIDSHNNQYGTSKPFLLYYSTQAIHEPNTPPATLAGQPVQGVSGIDAKADMIYELDLQVGQIIDALESRGIAENTLIIFTSDNGGNASWTHKVAGHDSVNGLRGRKTLIYAGGHGVPFIAKWGDGTPAGSLIAPGSVSQQMISAQDWVAAMYDLTNQNTPEDQALDSANIMPILLGQQPENNPVRNELIIQAAHWGEHNSYRGIRVDDWELVMDPDDNPIELYNLANDLAQQNNLINNSQHAARITAMLNSYDYAVNQSTRTVPTSNSSPPNLFIADNSVDEATGSTNFTVTLSPPSSYEVSVNYMTSDGSATAGSDYQATSGVLFFSAGETSKQIPVAIIDDTDQEGNEIFLLTLSNPVNAELSDPNATGTVIDNEMSVCDAPVYDPGSEGTIFLWKNCTTNIWHVRLTAGGGYTRYRGTVITDQNFNNVVPYSHESSDIFDNSTDPSTIIYDLRISPPYEDGFSFSFLNSANICFNVDTPSDTSVLVGSARIPAGASFNPNTLHPCGPVTTLPKLSINDISIQENTGGTSFSVTLTPTSDDAITVDFSTLDGTAVTNTDYLTTTGTLLFNPGEISQPVTVLIIDDSEPEDNENFKLVLSNPTNASFADSTGLATILDNDTLICGTPNYNPAIDHGVFVWQDCTSGNWSIRAVAGNGYTAYSGSVSGSQPITNTVPVNLEPGDLFDISSDPSAIFYTLKIIAPWYDGFDFAYPNGADICISINTPSNALAWVGPARIPIMGPFDPYTLDPC